MKKYRMAASSLCICVCIWGVCVNTHMLKIGEVFFKSLQCKVQLQQTWVTGTMEQPKI